MKSLLSLLLLLVFYSGIAQQDWNTIDFVDEYKMKYKIPGSAAKSLKKNPTFVSAYLVKQATVMTGSNTTATDGVYSEVSIAGIDQERYQKMVNELHDHFLDQLKNSGLNITDGTDALETKYAQKRAKKDKKNQYIGPAPSNPEAEKASILDGSIPGYPVLAVKRGLNFYPSEANMFYTDAKVYGNFYQYLAERESFNLIVVKYHITYASFYVSKGYKNINLETKTVLGIQPIG